MQEPVEVADLDIATTDGESGDGMAALVGYKVDFGEVVAFLLGVFLLLFLAATFVSFEGDVLASDGETVFMQVLRVAVGE